MYDASWDSSVSKSNGVDVLGNSSVIVTLFVRAPLIRMQDGFCQPLDEGGSSFKLGTKRLLAAQIDCDCCWKMELLC